MKNVTEENQMLYYKTFCDMIRIMISIMFIYTVILVTGLYVLPMGLIFVANFAGITYESYYLDIMVFIVVPGLFLSAFLFLADIIAIKKVWFGLKSWFQKRIDKHYAKKKSK